jgi:RHS repeat-associated protein
MSGHTENNIERFYRSEKETNPSETLGIPVVSVPKGGGAIQGIDEKFSVNAVNGTAAFTIPLPFSPSRGVTPSLQLSYNSGSGNGVLGMGWKFGLPSIKRKTEREIPQYLDSPDSDTFLFSETEDLVPEFGKGPDGSFLKDAHGNFQIRETETADGSFVIRYYRPRIEGLFARTERWRHKKSAETSWRMITRDNVTTLYGWTASARISDPSDQSRIFEWLPEFVFDDKGNCAHYQYKKENESGFNVSLPHNSNRFPGGKLTYTNTYLAKIVYGNRQPYRKPGDPFPGNDEYLFSTVFDYGEYDNANPATETKPWTYRSDAFSDYRPGFELRTTRLCHRVLLFHHFTSPGEYNGPVRSLDFEYETGPDKGFSLLRSVTSCGYIKKADGTCSIKKLPPVEFGYQDAEWNSEVKALDMEALVNAPSGVDDRQVYFTDLYNEGLAGMLTEHSDSWYYKANLGNGRFEPARLVSPKPSRAGLGSMIQLTDLDADGTKQLVSYHHMPAGYFEINDEDEWQGFRTFASLPNIDFSDPGTRLIDLNGDGKPEAVIAGENVFTWYPSQGREGFSAPQNTLKPKEQGSSSPIIFDEQLQTIFLADMSGDGLTDIVRIRNGEVCYWPNLGYGRFGQKVTFDNSPVFDHPDSYNPACIRLADIDGTGTTDIIYLGRKGFSCWKNLSGNSFCETTATITPFNGSHNLAQISVTDILGTGVACIVWSSPLPGDSGNPMRYIDLMNSRKPYLMKTWKNNLGKEVTIEYSPSTKYYTEDKLAGKPWITKLHFPVHCISKIITEDKLSGSRFVNEYSYHHGYYDHHEREFRGFGLIEQTDSESYAQWEKSSNSGMVEKSLFQQPVITKSWYHTGFSRGRHKILGQYRDEYWQAEMARCGFQVQNIEPELPDAKIVTAPGSGLPLADELSTAEWREAGRACKGMSLRTETFSRDAVHFANSEEARKRDLTPYTVTDKNYVVEMLQPKGNNKYPVFSIRDSESLNYTYERNPDDPRIAHNLIIRSDEFGNILESAAVVYPRKKANIGLPPETQQEQVKLVITLQKQNYTNDIIAENSWQLRLPSEKMTWELKAVYKEGGYYTPHDFFDILEDTRSDTVMYHETDRDPLPPKAQKRLIGHSRTLYFKPELDGPLSLHLMATPALPYETCNLTLTPELIEHVYSGRVVSDTLEEGKYIRFPGETGWWTGSGTTQLLTDSETAADALNRFCMPVAYTDPYGAVTRIKYYGDYLLLISETEDASGNRAGAAAISFRTLLPQKVYDINGNFTEVIFDELGLVKAYAVMGKGSDADSLEGLQEYTDPEKALTESFFGADNSDQLTTSAKELLQKATTRFVYNYDNYRNNGKPAAIATISRVEHFHLNPGSAVLIAFEYSDGNGKTTMRKEQAEPGCAKRAIIQPGNSVVIEEADTSAFSPAQLRWIGSGRTILNNKGNPVRQYEPFFSLSHHFEDHKELVFSGVYTTMYYDATGRPVKTELPGGVFTENEYGTWEQTLSDTNDTVTGSEWYRIRKNRLADAQLIADDKDPVLEEESAIKAAQHAGTPVRLHFDTLGRPVLLVQHNKNSLTGADEFFSTRAEADTKGNLTAVTDARGNRVAGYRYDLAGSRLYQVGIDSGQRWLLADVLGNPLRKWDERNHEFSYHYDIMHRLVSERVTGGDGPVPLDNLYGKIVYGESLLSPGRTNETALQAANLLGKPVRQYDTAGLTEITRYNFHGHPETSFRRLLSKYREVPNWDDAGTGNDLEPESYRFATFINALEKIIRQETPDGSAILRSYNEAGLLKTESVLYNGSTTPELYIKNIDYNEKGQYQKIDYGNDVCTRFYYDRESFRLIRTVTGRLAGNGEQELQNLAYTFDPEGNVTCIRNQTDPVQYFSNHAVPAESKFTYDPLYRLTEATGRENSASLPHGECDNWNDKPFLHLMNWSDPLAVRHYVRRFQYDAAGNILKVKHISDGNSHTRNNAYENANNRLTGSSTGNGTGHYYTKYRHHEKHGYLEELPHLESIKWNFRDELAATARQRCNNGNTPETTWYQYDGNGQRVRKITELQAAPGTIPAKKEERIYFAGFELYKKHSGTHSGLGRTSLKLTEEANCLVMIETRNDVDDGTEKQLVRYQIGDHLGSVTLELDDTARVISYEEYHPYGSTAYQAVNSTIRSAAKRYRYTGMERDEETGLAYHTARYYIPWLGRWLSPDPAGLKGGINDYRYTGNNPVRKYDTNGLQQTEADRKKQQEQEAGALQNTAGGTGTDPPAEEARPTLKIHVSKQIASMGFRGYDDEAKKGVSETIKTKLQFLNDKMDVEVDFQMLEKSKLAPGDIQVYLIETTIGKEELKKLIEKHGITSLSEQNLDFAQASIAAGHGLNIVEPSDKGPGLILVPVGNEIGGMTARYPGQTAEQYRQAREDMGAAIGELALHEIGHGFKLDHTKKNGKEVQIGSPPMIMDATIDVSSRSDFSRRDFTTTQKVKMKTAITKWMGIKEPKK